MRRGLAAHSAAARSKARLAAGAAVQRAHPGARLAARWPAHSAVEAAAPPAKPAVVVAELSREQAAARWPAHSAVEAAVPPAKPAVVVAELSRERAAGRPEPAAADRGGDRLISVRDALARLARACGLPTSWALFGVGPEQAAVARVERVLGRRQPAESARAVPAVFEHAEAVASELEAGRPGPAALPAAVLLAAAAWLLVEPPPEVAPASAYRDFQAQRPAPSRAAL